MTIISLSTLLIVSIVFSFLIAFPIIHILYKFQITRRGEVDFSNLIEDRKKKEGTPIMGGLIVIVTVLVLNLIFNRNEAVVLHSNIKIHLILFWIAALLGAFDDVLNIYGRPRKILRLHRIVKLIKVHKSILKRIWLTLTFPWLVYKRIFHLLGSNPGKGIQAHEKVLVQALSGAFLSFWILTASGWLHPTSIWFPLIGFVNIGILMYPFVIFVVISVTNAVNLSDGMDGLAAGLLLTSFSGFLIISILEGNNSITILIITLLGSLITYLYFNTPPARFQMGDVGSLALGTILAIIAFELQVPILLPIIGFPFVAEVGSSLLQGIARRFLGRRIFLMAPFHHHLEMKGWNEDKVVIRFWLYGIFCSVLGVWIYIVTF